MQLAKLLSDSEEPVVARVVGDELEVLDLRSAGVASLAEILAHDEPSRLAASLKSNGKRMPVSQARWLPPIDNQEVWAAGVTYKRSQTARMEESETAASCYDRVYVSPRPELFFKATAHRCSGHLGPLRIRQDASWNVPEPELTLVLSPKLHLVGYTVGNDMSSRDIEGDNPLYLPQAKVYDQCCGLGPWITLADAMPAKADINIQLRIERGGECVFEQATSADQMARTFEGLIEWLGRDNTFPNGAFLLTGTGIVPDSSFTLAPRDRVSITISGIGTLVNDIVQGYA
jgi:2-dehydro-3-deoxy-D-arabinonate dehydratase